MHPDKKYMQLELFPLTPAEVITIRIDEVDTKMRRQDEKLDKYRKAQFAKISKVEKDCRELFERLTIIERGLCQQDNEINTCEIVNMAVI